MSYQVNELLHVRLGDRSVVLRPGPRDAEHLEKALPADVLAQLIADGKISKE